MIAAYGRHGSYRCGLRWVALLVLVPWLAACGFHLRGAAPLPPVLERTQLIGISAREPLAQEIAAALENAGARVVDGDASALLHVGGERQVRRLLSVGSSGRASEYEISYQFSFELRAPVRADETADKKTVVLLPQQTVNLSRDYAFDPNAVLGKGEEEAMLLREMRSQAVQQMLHRLRVGLRETGAAPAP